MRAFKIALLKDTKKWQKMAYLKFTQSVYCGWVGWWWGEGEVPADHIRYFFSKRRVNIKP